MDPLLERRYLTLFAAYGVGGPDELMGLKLRLLQAIYEKFLRPDAALCLLALYDQMIFRPYAGGILYSPYDAGGILYPEPRLDELLLPVPPVGRDRAAFSEMIQGSLRSIFHQLQEVPERPISSHQVLRAIDRAWADLTVMFGWG